MPSGLGNYFVCKRFAVQTLMWSLEFVIQINLEHDTIAEYILIRKNSFIIESTAKFYGLLDQFNTYRYNKIPGEKGVNATSVSTSVIENILLNVKYSVCSEQEGILLGKRLLLFKGSTL